MREDRRLVAGLQRERRRRRRQKTDTGVWFWLSCSVMAGVYLYGPAVAVLAPPDEPFSSGLVATALGRAPAVWAAALTLALVSGLRVGRRGGPLVIDEPFVVHVLLAPVRTADALSGPAWRAVRLATAAGAGMGALAGFVLGEAAGRDRVGWLAGGVAVGVASGALWAAAALHGASRRLGARAVWAASLAAVAWWAADVVTGSATSPLSWLGEAVSPGASPTSRLLGAGTALVLGAAVVTGVLLVGGVEVEESARRSRLLRSMAFAAVMNDIRTAVVVRRALVREEPRRRPLWSAAPRNGRRAIGWRRGLRGLARWPVSRWRRTAVTAVVIGALLAAGWRERLIFVVAPALLLLVAFDLTEPQAQEADHPWRLQGLVAGPGRLAAGHLPLALLLQAAVVVLAVVSAAVLGLPDAGVSALVAGAPALVLAPVVVAARQAADSSSPLIAAARNQGSAEGAATSVVIRVLSPLLRAGVGLVPLVMASLATVDASWAGAVADRVSDGAVVANAVAVASAIRLARGPHLPSPPARPA